MILNYNNFVNEKKLFENIREMKFVLSKRLIDLLNKIDHPVSHELLKIHSDLDFKTKKTFVDIHPTKDDYVTYINTTKAAEILGIENQESYDIIDKSVLMDLNINSDVYKKQRGEGRIGRFINEIFGHSRFASELEMFVRMFKSKQNKAEKFKLMEVVSGDDIPYFYDCNKYSSMSGTLGNSCMGDVDSRFFQIYEYNRNVGMLVLYDNDNKSLIKGRAIVWMNLLKPQGRTFMDRIYTNNSSDEQLFIEYAIDNNWLYKSEQSIGEDIKVIDPSDNSSKKMRLLSQLEEGEYDYYPYMDTMAYYNATNGKISNRSIGMEYEIQSQYGNSSRLSISSDEVVFSNYHDDEIYKSEAKWCEFGQDWVSESEAIKVFNTGGKYAVPGHPGIVHSHIPNFVDKHFEESKCVWSDYLRTWVFIGSVRNIWLDKDKKKSVIDYKKRENHKFVNIEGEYYHIDLAEKNDNDEWEFI